MKKSNPSHKTHLLRIAAIFCLLSSYLWVAPSPVHALPADFQENDVLGNEEQTYVTGEATADHQMVYYDRWKDVYTAGLLNPVQLASEIYGHGDTGDGGTGSDILLTDDDINSLIAPTAVSASAQEQTEPQTFGLPLAEHLWPTDSPQTDDSSLLVPRADVPQTHSESNPSAPLQQGETTTLTVHIISSPWATLDSNNPGGVGEEVPQVFVVEAVITNTGTITPAGGLEVVLNYNEDPANNWELLPGEVPTRTLKSLAPDDAYHAYWFARYSTVIGASHQYTVTARADNADPVATSDNYYENPDGDTVKTRSTLSTGNSGVTQVSAKVVVGVAFTVTVEYDLGSNPQDAAFSPVGNPDFAPGDYRLLASQVRFFEDSPGIGESTVYDRLYFPEGTLPSFADNAEATFTFIALTPSNTRLCSYTAVGYSSNDKYDQFYCREDKNTIIPVTGTVALSMTKQASSPTIQQNQSVTYTIDYTNTDDRPLTYVWIWDDVDTAIGSIITSSVDPPTSPPGETNEDHVAWYLGDVGKSGQVTSTGTLTFTILVDGDGQDLANDTLLVNHAFFGINEGSLPAKAALTSTVTTTIQAPTIALTKTDGQATAEPGHALTYTLRITNSGSITATGLIITDVLPADVNYTPLDATPDETSLDGQTLVWNDQGPIAPNGGAVVITIPVTVAPIVPEGTILTNTMTVRYENPGGWVFSTETATDTTTVKAPVLTISKSDYPDPVLTGHLITYTLHYANNGPAAATSVLITDVVPLSTTYQACWDGSACGMSNGVVSWTIGTVPSNTNATVSFSVLVSDTLETGTLIRNEDYGIVADQTDFIPGPLVTTLVNREAAFIEGYAFIDANCDGVYDTGEGTLSGITITLTSATVPVTTTDVSGYYRFRVETQGPISVTAALPDGYFRTTPGIVVFLNSVLGITRTVNFGYAPTASTCGAIYGTVFEDANHDGNQDLGESGLQGVTITSTEATTPTVFTNDLGQYTLSYDISGTVTITETNPPFYVSTTPDVVHTNAVTGSSGPSPIDFGDFLGIKVRGQVFDDVNVNGVNDAEDGVSDAIVAAGSDSFTTGSTGVYTLYVTVSDSDPILVSETDPAGYLSTNAVPGANMSRVDANTLSIDSPISGTTYSGDFGDVHASAAITISGEVWNDNGTCAGCLANGLLDSGEPGLAGAVVSLSSGLTQTTASDGAFLLYAPPSQVITVTEANPDGYASTNAIPGNDASKLDNDTLVVSALSGGSTSAGNLFGDVDASSVAIITGTVFNDSNENGMFDGSESGLPGVTVTLEISGGNTIAVLTNPAGGYQFAVAPGTDVRITSAGPGGSYYPTTAESVFVRPPTAGVFPDNNFGYSNDPNVAVIFGIVFDDVDSSGEPDFGELGLAGAVITLTQNSSTLATITTSGNGLITGTFTFSVPRPVAQVVYGLHEQNPPGYRSTTPDDINVSVRPAIPDYYVEFGDTDNLNTASIYGIVFDDFNGNGLQDNIEPGLDGVVISVTVGGGAGVLTTTTKSYGQYSYGFDIAEEGYHTVSEEDPVRAGYHSTTPDEVVVYIELGYSYIVNFGDTTGVYANIMGTVFDDWSGDGVQDPAELGIEGVLISLSNGMTTTTDSNGLYTFRIDSAGPIQVIETDPDGYHSTTDNTVTLNVALDQVYTVDFGDRADAEYGSSFFGTVFEDQNVNGVRDWTELGLEGVTVTISTIGGTPVPSTVNTNQWGQYTFLIEVEGTYTVTETDLPGYVSTCAIPGDPAVTKVDNNTLRATIPVTPGRDLGANLFGDASQVITISGYVWDDNGAGGGTAGDGVWDDPDEPGLAGAVVSLSSGLTQTTGSDGAFLLYAPPSQVITVTETNPTDYVSTNAIPGNDASKVDDDTLIVSALASGSTSAGNLFGDALPADLIVIKSGDPPSVAAGMILTYTLVYINNGPSDAQAVYITDTLPFSVTYDGGVVSQPTGWSGPTHDPSPPATLTWYTPTLAADASGTIVFTVTVNPNASGVITNNVVITSSTLDTNTGNNDDDEPTAVGISTLATIFGFVFNDANGNGEQDAGELGIPGVTVTLDGGATDTTGLDGRYLFFTTLAGVHTVVETDPPNYFSTTPNTVTLSVDLGQGYQVDFGDAPDTSDFAAIYGTVFKDIDGDGVWDVDELGISSVTVTLDGSATATTDVYGSYTFSTTVEGVHTVVETDPPNYFSTTPNTVTLSVDLGQGYQVDFGDAPDTSDFAAIYGTVFHDTDSDGVWDWDLGELGISGVLITLDGTITATTDVYGGYTFSTTVTGAHTVVETDLPGYFSTTPNTVTLSVELNKGYPVDFGDVLASLCTCPPDSYEGDDTWQQAKPISMGIGGSQTHDFCDDDTDWITFTVQAYNVYTITTSSSGQRADTFLALFDTDASTLLAANDDYTGTTDYSSRIVWQAPADDVYYVRTTNRARLTGCATDYDLWIEEQEQGLFFIYLPIVMRSYSEASSLGVINHDCPDTYETDDTWQQAKPITGVVQVHSFDSDPQLYAADKDFVELDVSAGKTITFTISAITNTQTLLELWDEDGAALNVTGTTQLVWTPATAGHYYLSVSPLTTTFGCPEAVGYNLLLTEMALSGIYLPIIMRDY